MTPTRSFVVVYMPAELIRAGSKTFPYNIYRIIHCFWSKEDFLHQWKESIRPTVLIYNVGMNAYSNNSDRLPEFDL